MNKHRTKRRTTGSLLLLLLAANLLAAPAAAANQSEGDLNWPPVSDIRAGAWLVADLNSGEVLLSHEMDTVIYPASTTKIMTALLLLESGRLDETVTVSEYATTLEYDMSRTGFLMGETVVLKDVLYAMMLSSGNDAARIAAEAVAGTEQQFAGLMNTRAAELGMSVSHFTNSSGLSDEMHKTSASDMFRLVQAAMAHQTFRDVVSTRLYSMPPTDLHPWDGWAMMQNSNQFMTRGETALSSPYFHSFTGIKTGTTRASGYCLVLSAESWDDREIVLLLFGVPIDEPRAALYQSASSLLNEAARQASVPLQPADTPTVTPEPAAEPTPVGTQQDVAEPSSTDSTAIPGNENEKTPSSPDLTMADRLWQIISNDPWRAVSIALIALLLILFYRHRRYVRQHRKNARSDREIRY